MTLALGQTAIVVDASAAIQMLIGDDAWLDRWEGWKLGNAMLLTPSHFPYEVANGLLRGATAASSADATMLLRELHATGFEIADRGLPGLERAVGLAERHRLTVYDAAYLDLAIDVDGELATLDRALRRAAEAEGVAVI